LHVSHKNRLTRPTNTSQASRGRVDTHLNQTRSIAPPPPSSCFSLGHHQHNTHTRSLEQWLDLSRSLIACTQTSRNAALAAAIASLLSKSRHRCQLLKTQDYHAGFACDVRTAFLFHNSRGCSTPTTRTLGAPTQASIVTT
jgi:hypothetical protein